MAAVKKATWILAGKQRTSLGWTVKDKPMMTPLMMTFTYLSSCYLFYGEVLLSKSYKC
jgi:hypothetical protein